MSHALYIAIGVVVFLALGYFLWLRDLVRQTHRLEREVDYSKLRPQPPDEDD